MERRTFGYYSVNEALLASALAGAVFSTLSAQPLTIVGITGLISLFNYTIYDIVAKYDVSVYPHVMAWTGIWAAIFHWLFAVLNFSDYMRYVTDFSSQSFAAYVGIIYLSASHPSHLKRLDQGRLTGPSKVKGVEEGIANFDPGLAPGFLSLLIGILFFGTVYALERVGHSRFGQPWMRKVLGDYAYPIATIFWTGFSHIPGRLKSTDTLYLPRSRAFYPSDPAGRVNGLWLIDFWNLSADWVFTALPLGFLTMLLFYYDHNISSITAQARHFPLRKPAGFHWDFFLLGCTTFVAGVMGLPFPNGLVPQAPVHTDGLTTYETGVKKLKADDDVVAEDPNAVYPQPATRAVRVDEQRVSHMLMTLGIAGTMTGPLLIALSTIPRGLFVGVFFVVGWGSIEHNPILHKLLFLLSERRFVPHDEPLLRVPKRKIALFLAWQVVVVGLCVAVSQTIAAIGFPVLIIALIPVRWVLFPRWFTVEELEAMDALTAESDVVLASLGGPPEYPEVRLRREREGATATRAGGAAAMSSASRNADEEEVEEVSGERKSE